jgi:anti-sigma factor RsiW
MAGTHPDEDLVPYLRGELPAAARDRVAGHLAACEECRETAGEARRLLEELARTVPAAPAIDWGRYRAELRARVETRRRPWWRRPVPVAVSAAAASLALAIALWNPLAPTGPAPELATLEEAAIGSRLELLEQYSLLEQLELLEDLEVIRQLDVLDAREG